MASTQAFQNLIVSAAPGERIFTEGEVGTTMFIVQSGRVRLFREHEGQTVALSEMEKGDFFGEMSLLEATPRGMSAEALEAAELIEINSTTFDRMIRSNVEIAVRLLRKLSARLHKAEAAIAQQSASRADASPTIDSVPSGPPVPAAPRASASPVPSSPTVPTQRGGGSLSSTRPPSPGMAGPGRGPAAQTGGALWPPAPRPGAGQGPRLTSETGDTTFPLLSAECLLGRYDPVTETQPEVDLTLLDIKRSVSRRHARITLRDGAYSLIEEVGALNGTFVNGDRLVTGRPAPLKNEDRVSVGTVHLIFRT